MDVHGFLFMVFLVTTASAYTILRPQCACPQTQAYITTLLTPDSVDYVVTPCEEPDTYQLILPPTTVELPIGLGYLPSALPLVAQSFKPGMDSLTTAAYLPVSQACDSLTLATPVCPDWAPLVKPVVL